MARWAPNARERLHVAATELFVEQGYDNTTAAEIAERAGPAKSGFFRHFADKREVLFFGQELLSGFLAQAIAAGPADATPLSIVSAALEGLELAFPPERRDEVRRRGVPDATAQLAAEIGDAAAYTRWLAGEAEFGGLVRQAVDEFRLATIALG